MISVYHVFQSTLPTRGSDPSISPFISRSQYFNPRSPRGGATAVAARTAGPSTISIHAPHEGERPGRRAAYGHRRDFNPRSPRGGATLTAGSAATAKWKISIHAPHEGERHQTVLDRILYKVISIHAPHEGERQPAYIGRHPAGVYFNPRSPRGGATAEKCICIQHFREFAEYYPLRHGDARCIAPQDCIIQAFFGAKKRCFYVRLCFALKNKGVRG